MPNDCGWIESDYPAGLLNTPAKIDIVSSLAVFGIEATHGVERPAIKRHVTTGYMLGDCIGK